MEHCYEKEVVEISSEELKQLQVTIDFMQNAMQDVVGWANDANTKIRYMHECNRIHELATALINEVRGR